MDWIPISEQLPNNDLEAFDVTIEYPDGGRSVNVAIFRISNKSWELMIDKHHFKDSIVIAWKKRQEPY